MKKNLLPSHSHGKSMRRLLKITTIWTVLAICTVFSAAANSQPEQKVSLDMKNASYLELFNEIKRQTGLSFVFQEDYLQNLPKVNVKADGKSVKEVLDVVFEGTSIVPEFNGRTVILIPSGQSPQAQSSATLRGRVLSNMNKPIPGATVMLKGSTSGTSTDGDGRFTLRVNVSKGTLVFTSIGYDPQEMMFAGSVDSIRIVLKENAYEIEAVVSTGYYNVDKRHLTSSVTSIKADSIYRPGITTIDQMLEGYVPGMIYMQNSGQVGATPKLKIRGTTTVLGSTAPLWVLDGMILSDPVNLDAESINDLDFVNLLGNAISGINPEDIEQIDILKDASATAIYGPRASNGVIVITTKKGNPGPPRITYSLSGTLRQRPRYTDKAINVMNSEERIAYSRDLVNDGRVISGMQTDVGYESAYYKYYSGQIDHAEFISRVRRMETVNTDWLGLLMQTTLSQNHTLNVSGGGQNVNYYVSLGVSNEKGNIKNELNRRYTTMANVNFTHGRFDVRFGLNANLSDRKYTPKSVGVNEYAMTTARSVEAYDESGELWFYPKGSSTGTYHQPYSILHEMENSSQKVNTNQTTLNVSLGYRIMRELKADLTFSYGMSNSEDQTHYGETTNYIYQLKKQYLNSDQIDELATVAPRGGELYTNTVRNRNWSARFNLRLNTNLDADEDHLLTANLIAEASSSVYNGFSQTKRGYLKERGMVFDEIPIENTTSGNLTYLKYRDYYKWLTGSESRGKMTHNLTNLVAAVFSASYVYKNAYILNFNVRTDFSNKFGDQSNHKLLPIWSVSGRWNMHENVVNRAKWINTLALKLSFGYQGNMSAQESPNLIIRRQGMDNFFNEYYSTIQNYPNPHLKWEKTSNFNAELEFSLFKNKLTGNVTYYYRYTKDAFMMKQVSKVNGVQNYTVNAGTLENHGFEFNLDFVPIRNLGNNMKMGKKTREFEWRINPNLGQVINKLIDKIKPTDKVVHDDNISYSDYLNGKVYVSGRPVNTFYSYKFWGLDPQTGAPLFRNTDRFETVDGEEVDWGTLMKAWTKEEIYERVMVRSGNREPVFQGGLSNYLRYGNLILTFNLTYSFGNKVRLFKLYPNNGISPSPELNLSREHVYRWRQPEDESKTNIPGILNGEAYDNAMLPWWNQTTFTSFGGNLWNLYDNSTARVVSGNYLKLTAVSLRYIIPEDVCKKLGLKSAYVNLSGSNLYTFCSKKLKGMDPASQSGSSSLMNLSLRPTYSMQLNLTF